MSYQDHLTTCDYCQSQKQKGASSLKPTVYIKNRSNYHRQIKLSELGSIIKGISYPSVEPIFQTKGASVENNFHRPGPIEREVKLRALAKMIKGR